MTRVVRDLLDRGLQAIAIQGSGEAALALVGATAGLAALGMAAKGPLASLLPVYVPAKQASGVYALLSGVKDHVNDEFPTTWARWYLGRLRDDLGMSPQQAEAWAERLSKEPSTDTLEVLADALLADPKLSAVGEFMVLRLHPRPALVIEESDFGYDVHAQHVDNKTRWDIDALKSKEFVSGVVSAMGTRAPQWMRTLRRSPNQRDRYTVRRLHRDQGDALAATGMTFIRPTQPEEE